MKLIIIIIFSLIFSNDQIMDANNSFDSILSSYVDSLGKVNYKGIIDNPYSFNEYFEFIENISPNNYPDYFKTSNAKKAYWINTYNALILKTMIDNPSKNILEILSGPSIFGSFIFFQKFKIGGEMLSPHYIEHKILRKLDDPRIHFAINCASKSCPPLGNRILKGENLDKQLDEKAVKFINSKENVYVDNENKIIYLNKIFKWFKKDFGDLKLYICKYLDSNIVYEDIYNYKILFFEYDWSSNGINS